MISAQAATAEKWSPIAGVPPAELRGWLEQRRGDGYSVVALEQGGGGETRAAPAARAAGISLQVLLLLPLLLLLVEEKREEVV